ncbi:MAG: lysophospholipid acyltransferase family protein [Synergistaceae bacterium]|nr:lysophospholipid acyltransferase family protein [Synergistaceae bacterium]
MRVLPHRFAVMSGGFLGRVLHLFLWKKVDRCESRCVTALGVGVTVARKIIRDSFINLGRFAVEFVRFPVTKKYVRELADFPDSSKKLFREALSRNHGAILLVAHMGNWELAAMRVIAEGFPLHVVYTPQRNNDGADDFIENIRVNDIGMKLINGDGKNLRDIFKALKAGETVVIMQDLDARKDGVITKFLGLDASTHEGVVRLYNRFKCPVIPVHMTRDYDNPVHHHVIFTEILSDRLDKNGRVFGEDLIASLELCNTVIEEWIKETPEQWMWLMDRWESTQKKI